MRGIVLFSGTTEGRGEAPGITVHTGRMEPAEMAALLAGAALCVDATHPYAALVSANIRAACEEAQVPCLRLLRPASPLPAGALTAPSPLPAPQRPPGCWRIPRAIFC